MANPEHAARLAEGLTRWTSWRAENPNMIPDLAEARLEGILVPEFNLSWTDLRGAHLEEANLTSANLSGAYLGGVKLRHADLRKADLREADLRGADLREADLREANLGEADLRQAQLDAANLRDAVLQRANLGQANLPKADLTFADLREANLDSSILREADLRWADLRAASLREAELLGAFFNQADLRKVDLSGAKLAGATLASAVCGKTILVGLELSDVVGLDTVEHLFPSPIGNDTLARSAGRIPEVFLKGCGLTDWEIQVFELYRADLSAARKTDILYRIEHLLGDTPIQISRVFISYSWFDAEFVDHLGKHLDELRIRYWRDKKDASAGRLDKVIDRGIELNPTVLLVLSEASVKAPWVEYEIGKAVDLSRRLERDVLCPIALDDSWTKSELMSGELRRQIRKYNVLSFQEWRDPAVFHQNMRKLLDGLHLHYQR